MQTNDRSTVTIREAGDSPFMALLTELRCLIYSYLLDIAYQPVFPKPGICSWEVYRMPTALLRINKTVHEETKHPSIQKPIQKVNNRPLPKIFLGSTRTEMAPIHIAPSDTFHRAGKHLHTFLGGRRKRGNKIEITSLHLASWYNNTYLPQHVPSGDEAFDTQIECTPEHLYRFVRQTLKRMAVRNTCEIRARLLVYPLRALQNGARKPAFTYIACKGRAAWDTTRQALSPGMCRELKITYLFGGSKRFLAPWYDDFRARRMNIKVAKARARDWVLFDMAMSLC
ncbi:hypothetical protein G6011_08054 [Alternaria panax]|uniref:Uncharacterized protein n=1 Tax=Alternaria panax TaxID=48097 RepID=A0AAD4F9V1_9PLEO|nr:hypothetical protein G6011_08054 [Alternaria panax]